MRRGAPVEEDGADGAPRRTLVAVAMGAADGALAAGRAVSDAADDATGTPRVALWPLAGEAGDIVAGARRSVLHAAADINGAPRAAGAAPAALRGAGGRRCVDVAAINGGVIALAATAAVAAVAAPATLGSAGEPRDADVADLDGGHFT